MNRPAVRGDAQIESRRQPPRLTVEIFRQRTQLQGVHPGIAHVAEDHVQAVSRRLDVLEAVLGAAVQGRDRLEEPADEARDLVLAQLAVADRVREKQRPHLVADDGGVPAGLLRRDRNGAVVVMEPVRMDLVDLQAAPLPQRYQRSRAARQSRESRIPHRKPAQVGVEHLGAQFPHPGQDQVRVLERRRAAAGPMVAGDRHAVGVGECTLESFAPIAARCMRWR